MPESSSQNFTLYPLLALSVCFAAGILTASFLSLGWEICLIVCILFAVLSIIFINKNFTLIFLCGAFVAAGSLHYQIENQTISANRVKVLYDRKQIKSGDPIEIEGVLESKPELAFDGFFLTLKTERAIYKGEEISISGRIKLFAAEDALNKSEYEHLNLQSGSRLRVACNLRREDDYQNAGVLSQKELFDQLDIDATGIIKSPLLVEKIEDTDTFAPLGWVYDRRQSLINAFKNDFNQATAGVLIASLLGNGNLLDKQTADVFRTGGTFHVLVISGLHITFIGGLTLLLVQFFTNKRLWQFFIASGFLWAYSLAVGASVPVVRATIMFTILLFSQVLFRSGTLLNALGLCALILLVWRPNDIYTSSFQLTFASVGAIVMCAFPLIEKLRKIGNWSPSTDEPFPPNVSTTLRRFCEMFYWRENVWKIEVSRQLWSANLFKSHHSKWLEIRNLQNAARYMFEAILVSLIVQAWLLPFVIIYFHRLSLVSIFLNIWVGIVIALESFAAIIAVLFANVSEILAFPFIKLTEMLNWLLVSIPNFLTENNWASFRLPHYSGALKIIYILYFVPVIFLTFALHFWNPFALNVKTRNLKYKFFQAQNLRFAAISFLLLFALIIFHPFSAPPADGRLRIDFLDVGQGDSALIRFPNGETLLIDGGGRRNFNQKLNENEDEEAETFEPDAQTIGERVVSNFLWNNGYSQIDYILATHADADHIQGLTDVAKNFRVRAAMFGRMPSKNVEFRELFSVLQKREVESLTLSRGDVLNFGDVKVEILYPETDKNFNAVSDNNHSLVLRVIYGEKKFLLTGDIEMETERELLNTPEFLQTDVVKVAHHGSRTSSTENFVNSTKTKLAIISVGRDSPFGHPHEEVVNRWKNAGATVLTTGENGTISVSTDGRDLQVKTFNNEKILR